MALSRRLARPLLASIFVVGGWDALWNPEGKVKKAVAVTDPLAEKAGVEGLDAATLVRVNGAVQIAGGMLLAVGKFRRPAAVALIGSIIPTTYAGHRFWEESDPTTRAQQKMHFLKNVGLLGGLILAAFDTEGEPSLAWRAKRQARQLESTVTAGRASGRRKVRRARRSVAPAVAQASTADDPARARREPRRAAPGAGGLDLADKVTPDPETLSHAHDVVADVVKGSSGDGRPCRPTGRLLRLGCRSATRTSDSKFLPSVSGGRRPLRCLGRRAHHRDSGEVARASAGRLTNF